MYTARAPPPPHPLLPGQNTTNIINFILLSGVSCQITFCPLMILQFLHILLKNYL